MRTIEQANELFAYTGMTFNQYEKQIDGFDYLVVSVTAYYNSKNADDNLIYIEKLIHDRRDIAEMVDKSIETAIKAIGNQLVKVFDGK